MSECIYYCFKNNDYYCQKACKYINKSVVDSCCRNHNYAHCAIYTGCEASSLSSQSGRSSSPIEDGRTEAIFEGEHHAGDGESRNAVDIAYNGVMFLLKVIGVIGCLFLSFLFKSGGTIWGIPLIYIYMASPLHRSPSRIFLDLSIIIILVLCSVAHLVFLGILLVRWVKKKITWDEVFCSILRWLFIGPFAYIKMVRQVRMEKQVPVEHQQTAEQPKSVESPNSEDRQNTCPNCGRAAAPGDNFCKQCGTKLHQDT